jgi:hypothetical protein
MECESLPKAGARSADNLQTGVGDHQLPFHFKIIAELWDEFIPGTFVKRLTSIGCSL